MRFRKIIFLTLIAVLIVSSISCSPQKRAATQLNRLHKNFPELFSELVSIDTFINLDTLLIQTPLHDFDTFIVRPNIEIDSFFVKNEKVTTTVLIERLDTIVNYEILTLIQPDSFEIVVRDTFIKKVIEKEMVTKIQTKYPVPMMIFLLGIGLLFGLGLRQKTKKLV